MLRFIKIMYQPTRFCFRQNSQAIEIVQNLRLNLETRSNTVEHFDVVKKRVDLFQSYMYSVDAMNAEHCGKHLEIIMYIKNTLDAWERNVEFPAEDFLDANGILRALHN